MKLYIKNMVCDRCIMAVKAEAIKTGLNPTYIKLGEIELLDDSLNEETLIKFNELLKRLLEYHRVSSGN